MFRRLVSLIVPCILSASAASQPMPIAPPDSTWPMYGGSPGRNMANLTDRNILSVIDAGKGIPLLWKTDLGSRSYAQPVVAGNRVFVGANNERPRNKRDHVFDRQTETLEPLDMGVLMCFEADTGKFLWQSVHDKLASGMVNDWPKEGVCSIPTIDGDRVYYVSNRCTVVCLDVRGFADGNQGFQGEKYRHATDADVIWELDMIKDLKVFPHNMSTGCPLIVGDRLFVQTSNGVDEGHLNVPSPDAPSFLCLDKRTGKVLWSDNSPGKNIMHGQWACPSYAAEPVPQVIFPGGDGWLRAFEPETGKLLWKFDGNRKGAKYDLGGTGEKSDFIAAAVIADGRLYIGTGQDPEHFSGIAYLWCLDLARAVRFGATNPDRDVSPVNNNFDPAATVNARSALAWVYGGEEKRKWAPRDFKFGRTMSTVAVVDGIVYAPEIQGYVHCLDAKTGKLYWTHDTRASIWSAAYYVDGKVLVCADGGDLFVYRHDKTPKSIDPLDHTAATEKEWKVKYRERRREVEAMVLKTKFEFDAPIRGTPSVAGGVLFIATEKTLYAFKSPSP
jgi:outer membrane protein assembly factor BamB